MPAAEPYASTVDQSAPEVSSSAMTQPRVDAQQPKRGWRRPRATAEAGSGASYLRWPHPQR